MDDLRDLALVALGMALGALVFRIPPPDVLSFAAGAGTVVILRIGWRWLSDKRQARRSRGRTTPSGPHP